MIGIEHLQFAHPGIGRLAGTGIANRQPVVTTGWQSEFEARDKIGILFFGEQCAPFAWFANDCAVCDGVTFDGPIPTSEVGSVEYRFEYRRVSTRRYSKRIFDGTFSG